MARRFFIPFISLLIVAGIGYVLQAYQPGLKDYKLWMAFAALIVGEVELLLGLYVLSPSTKKLAKEILVNAVTLLVCGTGVMIYLFFTNDFNKMNI